MTIRPSSRSNGTGPARGDSRAGVTEVSGRRPGAGSSALEQTGEGAAPTRRRRAVRYDRQRPGHQQGADSATPRRKARGLFTGAEEPVGDPWDRVATFFRAQQEPVGGPSDGAAASGRPQPHLNTPHHNHKAPHLNRANHSPRLPSGERSPVGRDAPGERSAPGRVGHLGYPAASGERGASGTFGRRDFRAVEAVSRGPAKNAIIAQNGQKRPSKNRTTTTSAQMR